LLFEHWSQLCAEWFAEFGVGIVANWIAQLFLLFTEAVAIGGE
jgi:hypothetical protein